VSDGRTLMLLALLLLAASAALAVPSGQRPLALAVAGLLPQMALGAAFGSGESVWLGLTVAAVVAARRGYPIGAGLLAGAAVSFSLHALPAAALLPLALAGDRKREARTRFVAAAALALGGILLPVAWLDAGAFAAAFVRQGEIGPGVGLANLASYLGREGSPAVTLGLALGPLVVVASVLFMWRGRQTGAEPLAVAALALSMLLFFGRRASAFALASPLVLLAFSALLERRAPSQSAIEAPVRA